MSLFTDADDSVVLAAHGVLTGERADGTENVRRVDPDDRSAFVYRVDPDAEAGTVDESAVTGEGEFPDTDAVLWRADRHLVEQELERRNLAREV